MGLFDTFNFDLLNNSEFKEDSVREDLIMPILTQLGYSSSGLNKIRRGISLTHPFVHIGSQKRKINIVPDYILETDQGVKWILDAKAPSEEITKGKNVEQAYSYAINPEVRCSLYALCNGHTFVLFHISEIEPLLNLNLKNLDADWSLIEKELSPLYLEKPQLKNFNPDLGIHLLKMGAKPDSKFYFIPAWANMIGRLDMESYMFHSALNFETETYSGSFDFKIDQFEEFINSIPVSKREEVRSGLSYSPFQIFYKSKNESFPIIIEAKLSGKMIDNGFEKYTPLDVISFDKDPSI